MHPICTHMNLHSKPTIIIELETRKEVVEMSFMIYEMRVMRREF